MALTYNGNNLQTSSIITQNIDFLSIADNNITITPISHGNRSSITNTEYDQKVVKLSGVLIGTSITNLDQLADTFKSYFTGYDNYLNIDYAGSSRQFIATPQSVVVDRPYGLLYATFDVSLICSVPFGLDAASTTLFAPTTSTTATYGFSVTFAGTAPLQAPVITLTVNSVDMGGFTTRIIAIGNASTGQIINVNRYWNPGDIYIVDSSATTVTVNGVPTDYFGAFPTWVNGPGVIGIGDNLTSRNLTTTATIVARYL